MTNEMPTIYTELYGDDTPEDLRKLYEDEKEWWLSEVDLYVVDYYEEIDRDFQEWQRDRLGLGN